MRAHFAFANFFPKKIRPYINNASDFSYGVIRLLGVFEGRDTYLSQRSLIKDHDDRFLHHATNPVVECRRVRALKLLDKKFQEIEDPRGGGDVHDYEFHNTTQEG